MGFLEDVFGDFEDLETGEKGHENDQQMDVDGKSKIPQRKPAIPFNCLDEDEEEDKSKLQAKKAKLKSAFDAEYDQSKEPDSAYLDELKKEVEIQTKVLFLLSSFSANHSFHLS